MIFISYLSRFLSNFKDINKPRSSFLLSGAALKEWYYVTAVKSTKNLFYKNHLFRHYEITCDNSVEVNTAAYLVSGAVG